MKISSMIFTSTRAEIENQVTYNFHIDSKITGISISLNRIPKSINIGSHLPHNCNRPPDEKCFAPSEQPEEFVISLSNASLQPWAMMVVL